MESPSTSDSNLKATRYNYCRKRLSAWHLQAISDLDFTKWYLQNSDDKYDAADYTQTYIYSGIDV